MNEPVSRTELLDTIEDLVRQFAYRDSSKEGPTYLTGGLSTLEDAFDVLGWEDPHPCPENGCQYPGCNEWATGGGPTKDGYKRHCYKHSGL